MTFMEGGGWYHAQNKPIEEGIIMGDRSPKDKQKKQKQHNHDHQQHQQKKQENMIKNRKDAVQPDEQGEPLKKAG